MHNGLRRRVACNRCHSQKLRCPKLQGSESCARCLKARTLCVFSPSMRGGFRSHLEIERAEATSTSSNREASSRSFNWDEVDNINLDIAPTAAAAAAAPTCGGHGSCQDSTTSLAANPNATNRNCRLRNTKEQEPFDAVALGWTSESRPLLPDFDMTASFDDFDLDHGPFSLGPPLTQLLLGTAAQAVT